MTKDDDAEAEIAVSRMSLGNANGGWGGEHNYLWVLYDGDLLSIGRKSRFERKLLQNDDDQR